MPSAPPAPTAPPAPSPAGPLAPEAGIYTYTLGVPSQLLTLYITPVVYLYLDKVDLLLRRRLEPPDDLGEDQEFEHRPQAVAAE